ncbi:MAG TPA: RNA polymerase sigma factor, partial [Saprospiraceae bacterium]|nr:RNA polymerase sigma factor [Saprospiraceae bacterium]
PKDNLQDSFIKIFNRISSYNSEKGNIESWAKKILINTSIDKLKKHRYFFFPEKDMLEIHAIDEMEQKANSDHLIQLIEQLPDGYKQVFNLYEIEGYNHQEIAGLMGISESTSRSQLYRCKQLLQKMISKSNHTMNNHLKAL